jgi:hypothetical protein
MLDHDVQGKMLDYSRPVDIRAEVALLSRNIRIESGTDRCVIATLEPHMRP